MRLLALSNALALAALSGTLLAVGTTGCGPSELRRQYDAYVDQVEPLLQQEGERWDRIVNLIKKRQTDAAMPRYYKYVHDTALPYYTEFAAAVNALQPDGAQMEKAHTHLVRFATARLEFLHLEERGYDVYKRATQDGGLIEIQSGVEEAEALRLAYLTAIGTGTPDAKFGELYQIIDPFTERYFKPMQQQLVDPADVQVRLRSHVIPALRKLQRRKYGDDPANRLLKQCVTAWAAWHELLETRCPLLQEVMQAKANSEMAAKEAEDAFTAFREALKAIRLER